MFIYEKKLQYPVKIANTNPKLAAVIISQYGGPDGELGASLRYLSQRYSMPYAELKGLLTDIGTDASKRTRVLNPCKYCFFGTGFQQNRPTQRGQNVPMFRKPLQSPGFRRFLPHLGGTLCFLTLNARKYSVGSPERSVIFAAADCVLSR